MIENISLILRGGGGQYVMNQANESKSLIFAHIIITLKKVCFLALYR